MSRRSPSWRIVLRGQVWEMCGGQCEWPQCDQPAAELAHIRPRGMGHTGYRDTLNNVFAACPLHARVSDFEGNRLVVRAEWGQFTDYRWHATGEMRDELAAEVRAARIAEGYDPDGTETDNA